MTEYNTVIFDNRNLYGYKMNKHEAEINEDLREELIIFANKLDLPKGKTYDGSVYEGRFKDNPDYSIQYSENYGYFLIQGERGKYEILDGFPTTDRNRALYLILKQEIVWSSYIYECLNRDNLEIKWKNNYNIEYDSRKAAFEFALQMIYEAFEMLDDELVKDYLDCLNNRYIKPFWSFDYENRQFVEC